MEARISPRLSYLPSRRVKIKDLNAQPRRKEIFYVGTNAGAGGAAPVYAGIRGWSGHQKHIFWTYSSPYPALRHNGRRYTYDGASVKLVQLASADNPAWEINVHQGENNGRAPLCCPQWDFIRHYRYAPATRSWVVYERRWVKL